MTMSDSLIDDKYRQAEVLLREKRLLEARDLYREICLQDKDNASTWLLLGTINGQLKDPVAAEECFRSAITLNSGMAAAYYNLGISLRDQQKPGKAAAAFRAAVQLQPDYVEAYNALGYMLAIQGNMSESEQHLRHAITLNSTIADVHNNLGNVLRAQSRNTEAIASYRNAIDAQSDHLDAMLNLSSLLSKMTRLEKAIEWDRRILALRPDFAEVHHHLGNILVGVNRLEEAVESFRSAQRIKPDFADAAGAEAQTLQKLGRYDESCECILRALECGSRSVPIIVAMAAVAKRLDKCGEALSLSEEALQAQKLSIDEQQQLHFAIGKLHDSLGCYQEAFEHYRQANALYRGRFAHEKHARMISDSIELFRPDYLRKMPKAQRMSDRPIFIIGMPRSGTSLVEQILASHPRIFGAGELNDINLYANDMQERLGSAKAYPACLDEITPSMLDGLADQYLGRLHDLDATALRVTDKMPHNFLHLGVIAMLFPGARIIHTRRDPMDTCLSIYFQQFNNLHAYAHDLTDLGYYYKTYNKLMEHWQSVLDLPFFEIQYEALVAEPRTWIPRLVEFCDVEWDETCMRFHETQRAVNTPSTEQVREPMYSRSVGRWRHYEAQLEPLRASLESD